MALIDGVRYFTREKHIMQSLCVTCGTAEREWTAADGFQDSECRKSVSERTVYDLASLTKLFTGLSVMRLCEEGMIDLNVPAAAYLPDYAGLGKATVDQILGFEVNLVTPERVDAQKDRESGLHMLSQIKAEPQGNGRYYSDMHAMVLGVLMERVSGLQLFELFNQLLLEPLGMRETFCRVPQERIADCCDYDREHRIEGSRWILREGTEPGTPHDPKARLLGNSGEYLCGHAGLFSTRGDMVRLCRGILSGKAVSEESLHAMSRNRMGHMLPDGSRTQYLGSLCYVRHPEQYHSEIPTYMGREAIGLSGFTGNHVAVDPEHGRFSLCLGNRVQNRLTVLIPEKGKKLTDYGLNPDGSGTVPWPDGEKIFSSVDYVHQKDAQLHARIMEETGWEAFAFED